MGTWCAAAAGHPVPVLQSLHSLLRQCPARHHNVQPVVQETQRGSQGPKRAKPESADRLQRQADKERAHQDKVREREQRQTQKEQEKAEKAVWGRLSALGLRLLCLHVGRASV